MNTNQSNKDEIFSRAAKLMAGAEAAGGGSFFERDGRYLLALKEYAVRKGFKGLSVIAKFRVIESSKLDPGDPDPHPPGDERQFVYVIEGGDEIKVRMARNKLKSLCLAIGGWKESDVSDEDLIEFGKQLAQPQQPLMGKLIRGSTFRSAVETGKMAGKTILNMSFEYVPQEVEDIVKVRSEVFGV
jgi:hypothetical protein